MRESRSVHTQLPSRSSSGCFFAIPADSLPITKVNLEDGEPEAKALCNEFRACVRKALREFLGKAISSPA